MAMKSLAELTDLTLGPALAAQGFAGREIVARWPEIVGERLAARSRPLRIAWPRRRPGPGEAAEAATLHLKVEGAFALEMQQLAPLVIGKVNAHLGWKAVDRLVLKQGPVEPSSAKAQEAASAPAEPSAAIVAATVGVQDGHLRDALTRLGAAVTGRRRQR